MKTSPSVAILLMLLATLLAPRSSVAQQINGVPGSGKIVFTYTGENSGIPVGNAPSLLDKDYTITAEITVPKGGAEGMIVTLGGRFGGYGLFLQKGKPVFVYNLLDLKRYRWEGGVGGVIGEDLFDLQARAGADDRSGSEGRCRSSRQSQRLRQCRRRLQASGLGLQGPKPGA